MRSLAALLVFASLLVAQTSPQQNYDSRAYDWLRTNGSGTTGNLTSAGSHAVTLVPCPKGISGTGGTIYVSGTGTAEKVTVSAYAATTTGCTVTFTTVNAHSGAWSVGSANAGLSEAFAVATTNAKIMVLTPITVHGTASVPAGKNLTVQGPGSGINVISRATDFTSGDIFLNNANAVLTLRSIGIEQGAFTQSGSVLHGQSCGSGNIGVFDVQISNGYNGIIDEQCQLVGTTLRVNNSAPAGYKPFAGIYVKSHPITGVEYTSNVNLSDVQITSYPRGDANQLTYGVYSDGSDGVSFIGLAITADYPVFLNPTASYLTNWYIEGLQSDGPTHAVLRTTGTGTISGIVVNGGWANGPCAPATPTCTASLVGGVNANSAFSLGGNITGSFKISGMRVGGSVYKCFDIGPTAASAGIVISDSSCHDGNLGNDSGVAALFIYDGVSGVSVDNLRVYNGSANGFKNGVQFGGAATDVSINGVSCNLATDVASGVCVRYNPASTLTNLFARNILDPKEASTNAVASGTSVVLGASIVDTYSITGTTTITTITGGWAGRRIRLYKADAGSVTIGGGGNIPGSHTLAQYGGLDLIFNGSAWY